MKIESKNWILKIEQEDSAQNPRSTDYTDCNVAEMVCFHRNYNLGDNDHSYRQADYNSWDEMEAAIIKNEKVALIKPLYLYEHSGITIATTPFECRWDSGQVGFVFITKKTVLAELTTGSKYFTKKLMQKVIDAINSEVETYDQYLTGEVYWFNTENKETGEQDSCSGFYGSNIWKSGMSDHIDADCITELYPQLKAEFGEDKEIELMIEKVSNLVEALNV